MLKIANSQKAVQTYNFLNAFRSVLSDKFCTIILNSSSHLFIILVEKTLIKKISECHPELAEGSEFINLQSKLKMFNKKQFRNIKTQSRSYSRNYYIISVEGLWLEVGSKKHC